MKTCAESCKTTSTRRTVINRGWTPGLLRISRNCISSSDTEFCELNSGICCHRTETYTSRFFCLSPDIIPYNDITICLQTSGTKSTVKSASSWPTIRRNRLTLEGGFCCRCAWAVSRHPRNSSTIYEHSFEKVHQDTLRIARNDWNGLSTTAPGTNPQAGWNYKYVDRRLIYLNEINKRACVMCWSVSGYKIEETNHVADNVYGWKYKNFTRRFSYNGQGVVQSVVG